MKLSEVKSPIFAIHGQDIERLVTESYHAGFKSGCGSANRSMPRINTQFEISLFERDRKLKRQENSTGVQAVLIGSELNSNGEPVRDLPQLELEIR